MAGQTTLQKLHTLLWQQTIHIEATQTAYNAQKLAGHGYVQEIGSLQSYL